MPTPPKNSRKICGCGRRVLTAHPACSICRRRELDRVKVGRDGGTSQLFPGHGERMAKYTQRAAEGKPLFDEGEADTGGTT